MERVQILFLCLSACIGVSHQQFEPLAEWNIRNYTVNGRFKIVTSDDVQAMFVMLEAPDIKLNNQSVKRVHASSNEDGSRQKYTAIIDSRKGFYKKKKVLF